MIYAKELVESAWTFTQVVPYSASSLLLTIIGTAPPVLDTVIAGWYIGFWYVVSRPIVIIEFAEEMRIPVPGNSACT